MLNIEINESKKIGKFAIIFNNLFEIYSLKQMFILVMV